MKTLLSLLVLAGVLAVPAAAAVMPDLLTRHFGDGASSIEAPAAPAHKPIIELISQETPIKCGTRGCVCNAYGLVGGGKSRWKTFTGSHKPSEKAAREDALKDCRSQAFACSASGCWSE